jgi:hypothetical protein
MSVVIGDIDAAGCAAVAGELGDRAIGGVADAAGAAGDCHTVDGYEGFSSVDCVVNVHF